MWQHVYLTATRVQLRRLLQVMIVIYAHFVCDLCRLSRPCV